jgi:hypothetical protein
MTRATLLTKTAAAVVTQPTTNNMKPRTFASSEIQWIKAYKPAVEQEMNELWVVQVIPIWRYFGVHDDKVNFLHNKTKVKHSGPPTKLLQLIMNRFQWMLSESSTRYVMILMLVVSHCRNQILCCFWYHMYINRLSNRAKSAIYKKDSFVIN